MSMPVDSHFQLTWVSGMPYSSQIINTWHFRVGGTAPVSETLLVAEMEAHFSSIYSNIEAACSDTMVEPIVSCDRIEWNDIDQRWQIQYHLGDWGDAAFGPVSAGDPLPAGVAAVLDFIPLYRNHQGRKYFAGFTELSNTDEGLLDNGLVVSLLNLAADVLGVQFALETGVSYAEYVILDRKHEFEYVPISAFARGQWGYQRRRKSGYGS
jgi:hypothetical protein